MRRLLLAGLGIMIGLVYLTSFIPFFDTRSTNYVIVDFSQPSTEKRFVIYDKQGRELYRTYVAHGVGSGRGVYATRFSNKPGSLQTSLGKYKIVGFYQGRHGKSARLEGLSSTNSNARKRLIVLHGAGYIGYGKTKNSEGCFAVPSRDLQTVYQYVTIGTMIYARN